MAYVKKRAFLRLGALTARDGVATPKTPGYQEYLTDMMKNTILGMSVFGSYEYIAYHWLANKCHGSITTSSSIPPQDDNDDYVLFNESIYIKAAERSPVVAHFGAGVCSGLAQSTVMTVWEQPSRAKWPLVGRRAIHHAIGYASLFGSYEGFRRWIKSGIQTYLVTHEYQRDFIFTITKEDQYWTQRQVVPLITSFLAGGFAGQVHHLVHHITWHWKKSSRPHRLLPPLRSTLGAFGPTALAFVAFQYGGELTERMIEEHSSRL